MSGSEDMRAAEFVLGLLDTAERREVEQAAARDSVLAAEIAFWERRLHPLTALVPSRVPPAELWPRIEAQLDGMARGTVVPMRRGSTGRALLAAWAIAATAVAAGLGFLLLRPHPGPQLAVILPQHAAPGWLARLLPNGAIEVTATAPIARPADRDLELWGLPAGATKPVPLGLMPADRSLVLHPAKLAMHGLTLLVSLEPKGGSPTGLPTGPVLYAGTLLR